MGLNVLMDGGILIVCIVVKLEEQTLEQARRNMDFFDDEGSP